MRMLADTLTASDRVAIVVYAGASGLALPSTPGDQKDQIRRALDELTPGGSTNGAAGIRLAYDTAAEHFIEGGSTASSLRRTATSTSASRTRAT